MLYWRLNMARLAQAGCSVHAYERGSPLVENLEQAQNDPFINQSDAWQPPQAIAEGRRVAPQMLTLRRKE
jgi:hypothetical protein